MAGGRLQERARSWVRQHTLERGARTRLATHLRRQRTWVTKYVNGRVDADIDTLAAIADYFAVPVATLFGRPPLPRVAPLRDDDGIATLWRAVPRRERPMLRRIIELYVRDAATTRSTPAPARVRRATAPRNHRTPTGA